METTPQVPQGDATRRSNLLTPDQGLDVRLKDILKMFGLHLLFGVIALLLYPRSLPENNRAFLDPLASLLFLWAYRHYDYWPSLADFGLTKDKFLTSLKPGIFWGVGAQAFSIVVGLILARILGPWSDWAKVEPDFPLYLWGWASFFLRAVVFAPLIEEIMMRGIVFGTVRRKYGRRWGIAISTIVFALMHGINPVTLAQIVIPALAFVLLYEREGNLAAPVIAHASFNLVAFVLQLIYPLL